MLDGPREHQNVPRLGLHLYSLSRSRYVSTIGLDISPDLNAAREEVLPDVRVPRVDVGAGHDRRGPVLRREVRHEADHLHR